MEFSNKTEEGRIVLALLEERDHLSDRLDREHLEHEVTKGYRQHAEAERDELRIEVDRLRNVIIRAFGHCFDDEGDPKAVLKAAMSELRPAHPSGEEREKP